MLITSTQYRAYADLVNSFLITNVFASTLENILFSIISFNQTGYIEKHQSFQHLNGF